MTLPFSFGATCNLHASKSGRTFCTANASSTVTFLSREKSTLARVLAKHLSSNLPNLEREYLLASSQGNDSYVLFDAAAPCAPLGASALE